MADYRGVLVLLTVLGCLIGTSLGAITSLDTNFDGYVCTGSEAIITCTTDTGILRWYHDGDDFLVNTGNNAGDTKTIGVFYIVIDSIQDSENIITSTASTNVTEGFVNGTSIECRDAVLSPNIETITIYLADRPGPPTNFRNTSLTFSSVTLSWSAPLPSDSARGTVTAYDIEIINPVGTDCLPGQCSLGPSEFSTTIDNLSYNTEYTFMISASSCGGVGANASLTVFLTAKAPNAPSDANVCVGLEDDGNQLNMKMSWQCPTIDENVIPPILNYLVDLNSLPLDADSTSSGVLVPADCRCSYSTSILINKELDVLYSVAISSNNSIGSNDKQLFVYSSANISTEVSQTTASSALIAVSIDWQACNGVVANIKVTYSAAQSILQMSVETEVTLPTSRIFVPLNDLKPGTRYDYSVALVSSGGVTLGQEEQTSFQTTNDDVVTLTVCATSEEQNPSSQSTEGQKHSASMNEMNPQPSSLAAEECATNIPLLIAIGITGTIAIVMFFMFIIVLCICIRGRQKVHKRREYSPNDLVLSSTEHEFSPSSAIKTRTLTTDFNNSYGHLSNEGMETAQTRSNGYVTCDQTYEEIRGSKITNEVNHSNRPLIPIPTPVEPPQEGVYVNPDDNQYVTKETTGHVNNPAYGRSEREQHLTADDYLIVTETKN